MFDERKAAQASAYLITKENGQMSHLKLIKLLYLADRESYRVHNYSITEDRYYSMPHGPVTSRILDLVNGNIRDCHAWQSLITDKANHKVGVISGHNLLDRDFYDELSLSDIEILDQIYAEFGTLGQFELVDYTHNPDNVPEWENPSGGSKPIELDTLLTYLGKSRAAMASIKDDQAASHRFSELLRESL